MTEKEMKAQITQAHMDGYNRGYAKAKDKIADIKANCDLAIEGRDVKIMELEEKNSQMFNTIALQEQQIEQLREERNYFQETCEDIELNYYCDHKGVCKAQELEKEKCELLGIIQEKDKAIKKLIADIAGLEEEKEQLEKMLSEQYPDLKQSLDWANKRENENVERLKQAKEIIKNLLILKDDHFGNTKMEWRVEVTEQAEQFLKEIEKGVAE